MSFTKALIITSIISTLIILSIQSTYAQYDNPATSSGSTVYPKLGEEFRLGQDELAFFRSENIWIKFVNVREDSRCPADVLCIWQGRVSIGVNVIKDEQNTGFPLTLGESDSLALQTFDGYYIRLLKVEPYPFATGSIQPSEYAVTLFVTEVEDIEPIDTPLKQFKSGIPLNEIQCKKDLELIIKSKDGSPACVKPPTAEKLIKRGWARI